MNDKRFENHENEPAADQALDGLIQETNRLETAGPDVDFLQELEDRIEGKSTAAPASAKPTPKIQRLGKRVAWPLIAGLAASLIAFGSIHMSERRMSLHDSAREVHQTVDLHPRARLSSDQSTINTEEIRKALALARQAGEKLQKGNARASMEDLASIRDYETPDYDADPVMESYAREQQIDFATRNESLVTTEAEITTESASYMDLNSLDVLSSVDSGVRMEGLMKNRTIAPSASTTTYQRKLTQSELSKLAAQQYDVMQEQLQLQGSINKGGRSYTLIGGELLDKDDTLQIQVDGNEYFFSLAELQQEAEAEAIREPSNAERYGTYTESPFKTPWQDALSTFSIDVDTASYSNIRRMINDGTSVPPQSVRIEEMINYFDYAYPQPEDQHPFATHLEAAQCPWNPDHHLIRVGLKGREIVPEARPSANLVFLLDVSGSMNTPDKLPLVKKSMHALVDQLGSDDVVSIVVYAGSEGVALEPTSGDNKPQIHQAIDRLASGGSTHGSAGIKLAYKLARQQFVKGGINRVLLATDGDFNVGTTGTGDLTTLVEKEAKGKIFLTVLGYGRGNLNDEMMETITNKGNGSYHYIDSAKESDKVLVEQMNGTLMTIAKDVKIQVEFNPSYIKQYRLVGYDNRRLRNEDFNNDKIDAGDIGSGHTVTALYEVELVEGPQEEVNGRAGVDPLKYQRATAPAVTTVPDEMANNNEWLTVKLRYKKPDAKKSIPLEIPLVMKDAAPNWKDASADFRFASAVASFGLILRDSAHKGAANQALILKLVDPTMLDADHDPHGRKSDFMALVRKKL